MTKISDTYLKTYVLLRLYLAEFFWEYFRQKLYRKSKHAL